MFRYLFLTALITFTQISLCSEVSKKQFFIAAKKGDKVVIDRCLKQGIDVNSRTLSGTTALQYACSNMHVDIVQILLSARADVTLKNTAQQTALHHAVKDENCTKGSQVIPLVQLLLQYKASVRETDGAGKIPVDYALKNENEALVKLLLQEEPQDTTLAPVTPEKDLQDTILVPATPEDPQEITSSQSEVLQNSPIEPVIEQQVTKQHVVESYQLLERLIPKLPSIARQSFQLFGRYTYADVLCFISHWKKAAVTLYLYSLLQGTLPSNNATETISMHAVKTVQSLADDHLQLSSPITLEHLTQLRGTISDKLYKSEIPALFKQLEKLGTLVTDESLFDLGTGTVKQGPVLNS